MGLLPDDLVVILAELDQKELKQFKMKLVVFPVKEGCDNIPPGRLEKAKALELCAILKSYYGKDYALQVTMQLLTDIGRSDLAEILGQTTGAGSRSEGQEFDLSCGGATGELLQSLTAWEKERYSWSELERIASSEGGNWSEHSTAEQGRNEKCKLCPREEDLQEKIFPETVCSPDGEQETYRVHLPTAGTFCCSETDLGFEVRAPVTVQYGYDSWDRHLAARSTPKWMVAGPLFSIRAEPARAGAALHLPHFLCLTSAESRGEADAARVQIAHFAEEGMTLEEPTGLRPFHAVLQNPSFSLYGVLLVVSRVLPIPVHALVLIYLALRAADTTLHLYLIPNDHSLEKAIKEHEERNSSFFVDKSPQTKQPLYFHTEYAVSCLPEAEITPWILTFSYTSQEKRQPFIEVYIEEMKRSVQLRVGDRDSAEPCWEATLRPGDVELTGSGKHRIERDAVEVTRKVLDAINQRDLAEKLCRRSRAAGNEPVGEDQPPLSRGFPCLSASAFPSHSQS
nr:caspase recruitment domain-containing protein 8-like isoform X2 [Pelodiscus sinensis]|eukprot:XP_014428023.1 caspase recruitment domain-containing protein 8-like isoform X2 [Pelodiscus sinensis]